MPTLVNESDDPATPQEGTAATMEMAWMANNFGAALNDSTMSGSFLEEILLDMKRKDKENEEKFLASTKAQKTTVCRDLSEERYENRSLSRTLSFQCLGDKSPMPESRQSFSFTEMTKGILTDKSLSRTFSEHEFMAQQTSPTSSSFGSPHTLNSHRNGEQSSRVLYAGGTPGMYTTEGVGAASLLHSIEHSSESTESPNLNDSTNLLLSPIPKTQDDGDISVLLISPVAPEKSEHSGTASRENQTPTKSSIQSVERSGTQSRYDCPEADRFNGKQHVLSPESENGVASIDDEVDENAVSDDSEVNMSTNLLSPPLTEVQRKSVVMSPVAFPNGTKDESKGHDTDSSSLQSIELVRARTQYESPEAESQCYSTTSQNAVYESLSQTLSRSLKHLSIATAKDDENIFTASQSPISKDHSRSPVHTNVVSSSFTDYDHYPEPDISFGDYEKEIESGSGYNSRHSDKAGDSIAETSIVGHRRVHWDPNVAQTTETIADVRLSRGQTFHLAAIPTARIDQQCTTSATHTFPDPFDAYKNDPKLRIRLRRLYKWIVKRDRIDKSIAKVNHTNTSSVVLSMQEQYTLDLILRLLLEHTPDKNRSSKSETAQGSTLIVARSKACLEEWAQCFRERSSYTLLNHADLPLRDRKSPSVAKRAAKFDIVLTTYDALKSPDITVKLDSAGFALNQNTGQVNGWYTSKSSSSQNDEVDQNKQLSVLHFVNWRRVVFLDIIGKKGFLVKAGTARVQAARALNAEARHSFFVSINETNVCTAVLSLANSARAALSSLSSVLRIEDAAAGTSTLRENLVDFENYSAVT